MTDSLGELKICKRCVLDADTPQIQFDENGECSYCKIHDENVRSFPTGDAGKKMLSDIVSRIKQEGKKKEYDCIVGVSGGVDSTFVLLNAVKLGLRPLAVQFDNGWHSEIAVSNIKNACTKLGVDLHTFVVDWEEFKDILRSFLYASVPDADIATDIGIKATLYRMAAQEGLKYIITGSNFRTEGQIPRGWTYMDGRYIRSVQKKFGRMKLKKFPNLTMSQYLYYMFIRRIKVIKILNYLDYQKDQAKKQLMEEVNWRDYGGKHYESIYTRFNNGFLCREKFNIDKRKVEFAALVRSGQLTRAKAIEMLKEPPYSRERMQEDVEYVIKKLGLNKEAFNEIFSRAPQSYLDYPTYYPIIAKLKPVIDFMSRFMTRL